MPQDLPRFLIGTTDEMPLAGRLWNRKSSDDVKIENARHGIIIIKHE